MKQGKKIGNAIARFFYERLAIRLERKIEESQNQTIKENAPKVLSLTEDYAEILTDTNPHNSEQVRELLESKKAEHIEAGKAVLALPISLIKNPEIKADCLALLDTLQELIDQDSKQEKGVA